MIACSLRKLEKNDLELVLSWRNKDAIRHYMFNNKKISWEEHLAWFEKLQSSEDRDYQIFCIDDKPVGIVSLSGIDECVQKQCTWGFYIGDDSAPRGIGMFLGYYGIEHAFNNYNICKISSEVISFNASSLKFHKKLLFRETGTLSEKLLRDGEYLELKVFELDKKVWEDNKDKIYKMAEKKLN